MPPAIELIQYGNSPAANDFEMCANSGSMKCVLSRNVETECSPRRYFPRKIQKIPERTNGIRSASHRRERPQKGTEITNRCLAFFCASFWLLFIDRTHDPSQRGRDRADSRNHTVVADGAAAATCHSTSPQTSRD